MIVFSMCEIRFCLLGSDTV